MAITESELQNALLLAAPLALPTVRLFRRQIMKASINNRFLSAGIKGQADLYGYIQGGRVIELELKAYRTYTSPEQLKWEQFCKDWGVLYLRLRAKKEDSCAQTIMDWIELIKRTIK